MESSTMPQDALGFWRNVPEEITARVMSFLPVPDLCTCRSVCKAWKELLCRPGFLDLCDRKGPSYLFVTSHFINTHSRWAAGVYQGTMGVFDLEHRRWCSIPLDRILQTRTDSIIPRHFAMDDGLICELSYSSVNKEHRLVLFDPVAKTMWALPAVHGAVFSLGDGDPPAIVTVVENSHFKVFLLSNRSEGPFSGFFLYESSTDAWRDLGNPIEELGISDSDVNDGLFAESAVYFHGTFYSTYYAIPSRTVLLLSYNLEEGLWKIKLEVEASRFGHSELVVFGNCMFMNWSTDELHGGGHLVRTIFEVTEILENSSKSVVRIRGSDFKRMFYDDTLKSRLEIDISYGFAINSDLVVLFSRRTGKLVTYNMKSGCYGELPAHPLRRPSLELDERVWCALTFRAKLMNLSLRNILNPSIRLPSIFQATRVK